MRPPIDVGWVAEHVRDALAPGHASEKRSFGGITFLVNGHMLCSVSKRGLMAPKPTRRRWLCRERSDVGGRT